ncbi:hypothetical protein ACFPM7_18470 [Actinokineospora guangxiensis]|uniref:Serine/threonine protein kinase n=1 Tax=Actinokineospora guangxiensis TaxID=1490288 RepID=A0ABW0ERP3_9PSEU
MGNPDEVENKAHIGGDLTGTANLAGRDITVNSPKLDVRVLYAALAFVAIALIAALVFAVTIARPTTPAAALPPSPSSATSPAPSSPPPATTPTSSLSTSPASNPPTPTFTAPPTTPPALPPASPTYQQTYSAERALHHTNIDTTPPRRDTSPQTSYSVDFVPPVGSMTPQGELYAGSMYSTPTGLVAEWTSSTHPTATACADLADRAGAGRVRITENASYCLLTRRGTVAFLESVRFTDHHAIATVTVWAAGH